MTLRTVTIIAFILAVVSSARATAQDPGHPTLENPGDGRLPVYKGKYHFVTEEGDTCQIGRAHV